MKFDYKFLSLKKMPMLYMMLSFICLMAQAFAQDIDCSTVNFNSLDDAGLEKCKKVNELTNQRNTTLAQQSATTSATTTATKNATCEEHRKTMETAAASFIATGNNEDQDGATGTSLMQKCVKLSGNNMRYLYGQNGQPKKTIDWEILKNASDECIKAHDNCNGDVNAKKACENLKQTAALCDGAAFIISKYDRDWTLAEHVRPETVKGGNPEIKCMAHGIATIDYEGCAKFVQNGDIMEAAQSALQTGQELYYKDKAMTAQMEAASSTESATAGLTALQTGVKGQEDVMNQRAALNTGKFAALATYYSEIPSYEDLGNECTNYKKPKGLEAIADGCKGAVSNQQAFGFLMNQPAKEKMKAKLAKVGIDVTSNLVMANLMSKRAGDIGNAIANVDSFKPIDPLAPSQDMQTTYCQTNPGDSKCLTGGLNRTFDAISDNVITFGEGGAGTIYQNNNPYADPTATTTDSTTSPTNQKNITGVGSVISAAHQNGGLETIAPAATVSKGTNPTGGGGGGGGSGGGSGGGGGGVPGAQPQGGTSAAIQGRTPTYGGGSGTLSMMGGFGINKNKGVAKDNSNPFGKLFNKDGNKSGVVNFQGGRAPASVGNKGDNIFDMISKRYTTVSSDKRLLEYEMTK